MTRQPIHRPVRLLRAGPLVPLAGPAVLLPANYVEQVAAAGGIPVLLPPLPGIAAAVGRLDGLILTGGGDIDPAGTGRRRTRHQPGQRASATRRNWNCSTPPLAAGLPVLGVCRGMQLLNVARGGTLCQHLPAEAPGTRRSRARSGRTRCGSRRAPGSPAILGANGDPGSTCRPPTTSPSTASATAWSPPPGRRTASSRRWSCGAERGPVPAGRAVAPEAGTDRRLMTALVAAASAWAPALPAPECAGPGRAAGCGEPWPVRLYTRQRERYPRCRDP